MGGLFLKGPPISLISTIHSFWAISIMQQIFLRVLFFSVWGESGGFCEIDQVILKVNCEKLSRTLRKELFQSTCLTFCNFPIDCRPSG